MPQLAQLDRVFSALGDSTRRAILHRLRAGETTVGELAAPFELSLPAISKHLSVLERAGLVTRTARAQWRVVAAVPEALDEATAWLLAQRSEWHARFDRLELVIEQQRLRSEIIGGTRSETIQERDSHV